MAILTGNRQVHTVGGVMVNVMGKEIKGSTVIYVAVTLRTVAGNPAVLQGAVSVMTGGTGVMLDVVATIDKGLTRGNRGAMAGGTVAIQGDVAGA